MRINFAEKYRLFRSLPGYRRDNLYLLIGFGMTLLLSLSIPFVFTAEASEVTSFVIAAAGANTIFWTTCYALYHLVLPAILPYDKLRQRAEEAQQSHAR